MATFLRRHRLITGFVGLVALLAVAALLVLNWLFEESGVPHVRSIAEQVDASSVLAVFAHPDDEQLVTGLLIRAAEDDGVRTAMVTATPGDAGTQMPQVGRQRDLGHIRRAETLKNTWALGVEYHDVLDYPDGGLVDIPIAELVGVVRERMIEHEPDLVLTFWPTSGFSDHADHKRIGLVAEMAIQDLQANPVDGYAGPDHIAYMLAPTRMMGRLAGETGRTVVANQPLANFSQPGEGWAKMRGWQIHASQRNFVQNVYGFPAWFIHRLYDKEFYYVIETADIPER